MKLHFYGAAREVTGSCFLLETEHKKILVDCGLFQGSKELSQLNDDAFAFNPGEIDYMLLTHAHIDHSGRIPKLVRDGYTGNIYATEPTCDLCDVMLRDSAYIQEKDAEIANRKNKRKGAPLIEPIYETKDVETALKQFKAVKYKEKIDLDENISVTFIDSGHMLGSAYIELQIKEADTVKNLVFTGDIGNINKPILSDPSKIDNADYLICESTYGGRIHSKENAGNELLEIILKTADRNGTVVIPAFAVGRTQEVLYELNYYKENKLLGKHEDIRVFVDSPLAIKATEIFKKYYSYFDKESQNLLQKGDDPLVFDNLQLTLTTDESKAINADKDKKIVISASGMCDSGRILHHLKHTLWDAVNTVVIIGYQAANSMGRRLIDKEKSVKIHGEEISVNAEIESINSFSGHADQQMIIDLISNIERPVKNIVLVHGEENQIRVLENRIKDESLAENVFVPSLGESIDLDTLETKTEAEINYTPKLEMKNENYDKLISFINERKNTINAMAADKFKLIFQVISDILK